LLTAYREEDASQVDEKSVSINTGPDAGNVLDKKDSDFTDPRNLQNITTRFTDSISPVTSNTLLVQLGINPDPLGKNPDSVDIINATSNVIDLLNDPNIGSNVRPRANSDPLRWHNPTALDIFVGVSSTSGSLVTNPNAIVTPGSVIIPTTGGPVIIPSTNAGNANDTSGSNPTPSTNGSNTTLNPSLIAFMPINIWSNNPQNQNTQFQNTWFTGANSYMSPSLLMAQPATNSMYPLSLWMPSQNSYPSFANQYYSSIPQSYPQSYGSLYTSGSNMYNLNASLPTYPQIAYNLA
jgi:hypothetical protein